LTANSKADKPGRDVVLSPLVSAIARKYGVSPQLVFYRWAIAEGMVPLNGTCSAEHMREDLQVCAISLSDIEVSAISELLYEGL
jgi:diketogulonate reductase-like aldo/keto reductase